MRTITEHLEESRMKDINSLYEDSLFNDAIMLTEDNIDEGVYDKLQSAKESVKNFVMKLKKWVVMVWNDKIIPAVSPINSFLAYKLGYIKNTVLFMSKDSKRKFGKFVSINSSEDDVLKLYSGSTLDDWKAAAKNVVRENLNEAVISLTSQDGMFGKNVNKKMLMKFLEMNQKSRLPLMIWGAPGIGKTAIVRAFLKTLDGKRDLIVKTTTDMRADDFSLPYFEKDSEGNVTGASDLPKSWLPVYKPSEDPAENTVRDNICNGGSQDGKSEGLGGIIFLDEFSRASINVQNVLLSIIQDREYNGWKIGSKWTFVAASNRSIDDPAADINFSKTLANRFIHINYAPVFNDWKEWAEKQGYISKEILSFLEFNQKYWYMFDPEAEDQQAFPTMRTWDNACQAMATMADTGSEEGFNLDDLDNDIIEAVLTSTVGLQAAREFIAYHELVKHVDLRSLYDVWNKPKSAPAWQKRIDLNYFMITKCIMQRVSTGTQPTPEEFANYCEWLGKSKDESLASAALHILFKEYPGNPGNIYEEPGMAVQLGDPALKDKVKDYDKYKSGVDILIKNIPGLDADVAFDLNKS